MDGEQPFEDHQAAREQMSDPISDGQISSGTISNDVEQVGNESMSAETNLPTDVDPQVQPEATAEQPPNPAPNPAEMEFNLEPESEPIDLTPEAAPAATEDNQAEYKARIKELVQTIDSLKAQLDERSSQLDDRNAQYMRIAADFDNYRRRVQKEKEEMEQQVKCSTITELLQVVDNFERARSQLKPQSDGEMNIHKSYQGIYKQFVDALKKVGVSPMRAEGQEFDPNLHEAVMREPTSKYPEGHVSEELVRGYMLGDRVIRHALVKVAMTPEPGDEGDAPVEASESDG